MKNNSNLVPENSTYQNQFWIGPVEQKPAVTNRTFDLNSGYILALTLGTKIIEVKLNSGEQAGFLLGDPIDLEQKSVLRETYTLSTAASTASPEEIEQAIYKLAGSWIFICTCNNKLSVYLDADATLGLVYNKKRNIAASTTGLILDNDEYENLFQHDLYESLAVRRDGWVPGGLTAHKGINRLIVNHYLDLQNWEIVRHWPNQKLPDLSHEEIISRIVDNIRNTVFAISKDEKLASSLTGGNETRALLGCLKDIISDIDFYTIKGPDSAKDIYLSSLIADTFTLKHDLLPLTLASEADQKQYLYSASHCAGGSNVETHPSLSPLKDYNYMLGGLGGEIGRGFLWKNTDTSSTKLDPVSLTSRLGLPENEIVQKVVIDWVSETQHIDQIAQLDLAYIELRMCPWGFVQSYCQNTVKKIHPLISRENYELMLSIPDDWKKNNVLINKIITATWPELYSIPIKRYGNYRDQTEIIMRAIKNPHLVIKKLRKIFS